MKLLPTALAIACTLLVSACLPVTTQTPIGTTAGLGTDEALYGTWKCGDKKSVNYFHFLMPRHGTMIAINVGHSVAPMKNGKESSGSMTYALSTTTLRHNHYINANWLNENGESTDDKTKKLNFPLLYRFGNNHTLKFYQLDEDKVKEAIKAGIIAGEITHTTFGGDDVTITADAAALDAFMATPEAAKLFKVFIVLRKAE